MKKEQLVAKRVSNYLLQNYPEVIFRFDLAADMRTTIGVARRNSAMHGKWSKGYPDLFIAEPRGKHAGLYLELKAIGANLNTPHCQKQKIYLGILKSKGYKAKMVEGFEEAKQTIERYLK